MYNVYRSRSATRPDFRGPRLPREKGFSLVELMVTVSIGVILLTVAIPNFSSMIRENRLSTQANELLGALSLARSEAIKRGQSVTVCKANVSASPPSCNTTSCDTGTGANCWEKGWLIMADADEDSTLDSDGDTVLCEPGEDCVIRIYSGTSSGYTLRTGTGAANRVVFRAVGGISGNDTYRLCQGTDKTKARSIALNITGRASISKGASACP